jgi:membrane-associated phospholipid phosphatase
MLIKYNQYLLLLIACISGIPKIDKYITSYIQKINTIKVSNYFSNVICEYNVLISITICYQYGVFYLWTIKAIIDFVIINSICKVFIKRYRPREIETNNRENTQITLRPLNEVTWDKIFIHNSFPSGHVTSSYTTYLILKEIKPNITFLVDVQWCLFIITIYGRINVKAHYLSDCMFAICISQLFFDILNANRTT